MEQRKPRNNFQQTQANTRGLSGTRQHKLAAGSSMGDETLAPKFNQAAQQPKLSQRQSEVVTRKKIDAMRRQMSQPKATFEYGVMGSVTKARNSERDRKLGKKIKAYESRLNSKKGLNKNFGVAANNGKAKQEFNRAPRGMGR